MDWMQSYFGFIDDNGCLGHFLLGNSRYRWGKLRYIFSSGLGRIVFWNVLDMSNIKIINTSAYSIEMMIQIDIIAATGVYEKVN